MNREENMNRAFFFQLRLGKKSGKENGASKMEKKICLKKGRREAMYVSHTCICVKKI